MRNTHKIAAGLLMLALLVPAVQGVTVVSEEGGSMDDWDAKDLIGGAPALTPDPQ